MKLLVGMWILKYFGLDLSLMLLSFSGIIIQIYIFIIYMRTIPKLIVYGRSHFYKLFKLAIQKRDNY